MPVINPDGYIYNETISPNGGGMWYKNRRDNGDGSIGVNLNSNFGYQWGYDDIGSSPVTTSNFYRGTGPFSEPETQVVRDYCINHNFLIGVNYHTTSGMAYWRVVFPPWGYNLEQTSDSTIYNQLIRLVIALNNYSNGAGIGRNNGDVADWMYGETNEKNFLEKKIDEVLRNILKKPEGEISLMPYSILKKNGEALEMSLEELKKNFYSGQFLSQSAEQMAVLIESLLKQAQALGLTLIGEQIGDLLSLLTRKRMPGVMRLKKEIRDLLALKETEFQEWKKKVGLPTWKKHD